MAGRRPHGVQGTVATMAGYFFVVESRGVTVAILAGRRPSWRPGGYRCHHGRISCIVESRGITVAIMAV